ncbi:SH3 domain-containing protein [Leptospira sp. 96542]|nr:SH3 domain-containing protein [Leptospira sp. 96542]
MDYNLLLKRLPILLLISIILSSSCVSKQAIGLGYTYQGKVSVYKKPSTESIVLFNLNSNQIYDIIGKNIPDDDPKQKLVWLRVYINEEVGYISQEEELVRKSIFSFSPVEKNRYGLVTATSLLLRDAPSQQGKIIGKLKTREIIELILDSNSKVKIGNLDGTWAKVKTDSGQTGFVFTAYVMRAESLEVLKNTDSIELYQPGWAYLKTEPKKVFEFEKGKLNSIDKDYSFPEKGDYFFFNHKLVTKDSKVYFKLIRISKSCSEFGCDDENIDYSAYIPAENLKTYANFTDLYFDNFQAQLKERGINSKELMNSIESALYSDVDSFPDISTLSIEEKTFGKNTIIEATISYKTSYTNEDKYYTNPEAKVLLRKNGSKYDALLHGNPNDIEFKDTNGDGIDEVLVNNYHLRSGMTQSFYVFDGKGFQQLLTYDGDKDGCGYINLYSSYVQLSDQNCTNVARKNIKHFEYNLKKNKLVPVD